MVFILDDDNSRIRIIRRKFGTAQLLAANDPVAGERILRKHDNLDIIFLDHDLGGPYTRGPLGDGIDLAKVMKKDGLHKNSFVIVHSLNRQGAQKIKECLSKTHKNVKVLPFYELSAMSKIDIEKFVEDKKS
jgi:hypothetical protein